MRTILLSLLFLPCFCTAQYNNDTLATVVCTAQAMPTDIRQAVHPIRVLDQKTIACRGVSNLEELLASETSFRFSSDLILGAGIQLNGVGGENVKIMIDGVPVIGRLNGNVDLSQIPLYNIQRVEIVQGALSAYYGSNASGGVINLITKKTQAKTVEATVNSQMESVGIKTISAKTGVRKGKFLAQLGGQYYTFSGYPVDSLRSSLWNPKEQQSAQAMLKYYLNPSQTLTYSFNIFDELVSDLGDIKRPTFKPYSFDSYYKTLRKDMNLNYEATFKKLTLQSTLGYNQFVRHKNTYRLDQESQEKLELEGEQDTSLFKATLWRSVFSYPLTEKITMSGGTDAYYENAEGRKIVDSTENKRGFAQMGDYAAFLSTKMTFLDKKLIVQPTVRYGYNSKYNAPVSPSLNILYRCNTMWSIRGGYARGFRAPSLKELYFNFIDINHYIVGSTNIKAERSDNFTLNPSFSKQYNKINLQAEGNLFYNNIQNRIILAEYALLKYRYDNIAIFKTKGAGINTTLRYKDTWTFKSNVTYTGYYNTARDEKPDLPVFLYSPEIGLDWSYSPTLFSNSKKENINPKPLLFNILYRHTGSLPQYNLSKNNEVKESRLSAWDKIDASLTASFFKQHLILVTGVKNILNVQNIRSEGALAVGHNATAGSIPVSFGRSYFVKVGVNW
ncbi:MAG: hypothetical protein RLZZ292_3418 [Bacteroidota bacterium]|jgi:outer membrane receptor for ferrienterochelin and colicins